MAVVLLAAAAAGVLLPFVAGAGAQAEGVRRTLAARLAADMVEQALRTPFDQLVETYDGYTEAQGQLRDAADNPISDPTYANFSREVRCRYVYVPQESGATDPVFILLSVSVYYNQREVATVNRLVSR